MTTDLVIYGMKGSPFVRKVQVLLAEKGLEYEFVMASPFPAPDWFAEISPAKRIPVLRDRSIGTEGVAGTIPDSSAICAYVERKYPQPALYPHGDFDYGRALWFEEYADSELAARVGLGLFRPMVMAKMFGKEPDVERARKTLREDLPPIFDYLEKSTAGRQFLVGEALSIADVAVATQFVNFHHAGAHLDTARWPSLAGYIERMHSRPSFAECIAAERQFIPASDVAF
jgi:glutathione S-transferase